MSGLCKHDFGQRYAIRSNATRRIVGYTDDLGAAIPEAHSRIDRIGEDGLPINPPASIRIRMRLDALTELQRLGQGFDG